MPSGMRLTMTNKRKREETVDRRAKRQRIRKRSHSEPLRSHTQSAEKRQALNRLFGRICSVEAEKDREYEETNNFPSFDNYSFDNYDYDDYNFYNEGETEDPLLDSVPEAMDPEQLGFLVCAQETLRFLHLRGISNQNPVFNRLRSRLLRGIGEITMA